MGAIASFVILKSVLGTATGVTYILFQISSAILAVCGTILNVGIQITTNLGTFITHTPVIYTVWAIIRDISSMFLIFFILWAAIQMIIGIREAQYGNLIKNIVIMGILINFSFFFTQVLIDASNIVSLQFSNAIMPQANYTFDPTDSVGTMVQKIAKDGSGGFSGIFMSSLRVTTWWNIKSAVTGTSGDETNKLIQMYIANILGMFVQIIVALSFLAAGAATIYRTVILIFLLAFSPIWIAAYAVPQLSEFKDRWVGQLKANLVFLPVYLGFMYIALRIVTESGMNNIISPSAMSGTDASAYLQLFVGFSIIIFMINIPLIVAVQVAGSSVGWTQKMFQYTRGRVTGFLGTRTLGAVGGKAEKYMSGKSWGNNLLVSDLRSVTTGKLANQKYGGVRSFEQLQKEGKEAGKKIKEIERVNQLKSLIDDTKRGIPPTIGGVTLKDALKNASAKDLGEVDKDAWANKDVIKNLRKDQFESIMKSDNISEEDKNKIKKARIESFQDAVNNGDDDTIKKYMKDFKGEELVEDLDNSLLDNPKLVKYYTNGHLKSIDDNSTDITIKSRLATAILKQHATSRHSAAGWILKQQKDGNWT